MKYVSIYPWDVISNIKKGRKVFVLDPTVQKGVHGQRCYRWRRCGGHRKQRRGPL